MITNIFIAGVGGQGIILAGQVISEAALLKGYAVRKSEVHGMAQRGGSVTCQVRYGEEVYSPLIPQGQAGVLVGMERLEALRHLEWLSPGGTALVNDYRIDPAMLIWGKIPYPENVAELLKRRAGRVVMVPAHRIAEELGNLRVMNVIMLGALSAEVDLGEDVLISAIEKRVPAKSLEVNIQGFLRGRQTVLDAKKVKAGA
jgi:indolepyruvate ferredoxin oxidoreductase beta subunit